MCFCVFVHRTKLAAERVEPLLLVSSSGAPSASCLCLVTPDGQRTMRTCLGASLELKAADQLPTTCVGAAACRATRVRLCLAGRVDLAVVFEGRGSLAPVHKASCVCVCES